MLPNTAVAIFLTICLAVFVGINIYNMIKSNASKQRVKYEAEVERPGGPMFALAVLGTGIFFLESVLYIVLVLTGFYTAISNSFLQLQFPYDSCVQLVGILATAFGYVLFLWSVLARGRYATSWEMPENQKLVTWGPYRYVRHPSYLAYFILFAGLFLTLLNLIALMQPIAVLGYLRVATIEEELLTKRFGEAYLEYQRRTGKFFPKIRRDT
jgi:protein-S-isoprenylcysteine O-methyltransferase Ste14